MSQPGPERFIGMRSTAPQLKEFLSDFGENPTVDKFAEMDLLDFPRGGFGIYFDKTKRAVSIFLHGPGHEDHNAYRGPSPFGLSFQSDRRSVLEVLGHPSASGKEKASGSPWDR